MKSAEMKVVKFDSNDVIATSGFRCTFDTHTDESVCIGDDDMYGAHTYVSGTYVDENGDIIVNSTYYAKDSSGNLVFDQVSVGDKVGGDWTFTPTVGWYYWNGAGYSPATCVEHITQ